MGFWSKLGKIGLVAAPYVAAPFTGGASLAFAPAANKGLQAWNAKDARNAAAKGIAPSNFDKYLGMGSEYGSLASGFLDHSGIFNKGGGGLKPGDQGPRLPTGGVGPSKGFDWGRLGNTVQQTFGGGGGGGMNIPMSDDPRNGGISGNMRRPGYPNSGTPPYAMSTQSNNRVGYNAPNYGMQTIGPSNLNYPSVASNYRGAR